MTTVTPSTVMDVSAIFVATTILRYPFCTGRKTAVCSCDVKLACSGRTSIRSCDETADRMASTACLISYTPVMKTRTSPPTSRDRAKQYATWVAVAKVPTISRIRKVICAPETYCRTNESEIQFLRPSECFERGDCAVIVYAPRFERCPHSVQDFLTRLAGRFAAGMEAWQVWQDFFEVMILDRMREPATMTFLQRNVCARALVEWLLQLTQVFRYKAHHRNNSKTEPG